MRPTIGKTQDLTEEDWELSRFCTKLYTNVSGGARQAIQIFFESISSLFCSYPFQILRILKVICIKV